jgi:hypothetical protein
LRTLSQRQAHFVWFAHFSLTSTHIFVGFLLTFDTVDTTLRQRTAPSARQQYLTYEKTEPRPRTTIVNMSENGTKGGKAAAIPLDVEGKVR